jgi:hypothetical protein
MRFTHICACRKGVNRMKKVLVGIALITVALSVNASGVPHASPLTFTAVPPACQIGQTLVPIYNAKGVIIGWICAGNPSGPDTQP